MARIKLHVKRIKYNNRKVEYKGWLFHSQLECDYYKHLEWKKECGLISLLMRQVNILLAPKCKLVIDFIVQYVGDRVVYFYDTKGYITQTAKTKIAMAEHLYGIKIHIIKRGDF